MGHQPIGTLSTIYLERYAYNKTFITQQPPDDLALIVTIPCYNEESLIPCLESLWACALPEEGSIEVLVIVNESETADQCTKARNEKCYAEAVGWATQHHSEQLQFYIVYEILPKKHAGVGLARKAIMDEATRRFEHINRPEGVILCYDADCSCDENYLKTVISYFDQHPKCPGASIYFEHPLEGALNATIYEAIIDYELFLRYYVNALRFAGFPFAFETIGSSMAVRANAYQKQGGMNRRKAGEDFYFLHRIIPLGHFGEINDTRVIPSPRQSDRVPFGTGRAVNQWLENEHLTTYHPNTFVDLKSFLDDVALFYKTPRERMRQTLRIFPESIQTFLEEIDGISEIERINKNVASRDTFTQQFFQWFDGFKVLKFVHYARDHYYPNQPVFQVALELLQMIYTPPEDGLTPRQLLSIYREIDRMG